MYRDVRRCYNSSDRMRQNSALETMEDKRCISMII